MTGSKSPTQLESCEQGPALGQSGLWSTLLTKELCCLSAFLFSLQVPCGFCCPVLPPQNPPHSQEKMFPLLFPSHSRQRQAVPILDPKPETPVPLVRSLSQPRPPSTSACASPWTGCQPPARCPCSACFTASVVSVSSLQPQKQILSCPCPLPLTTPQVVQLHPLRRCTLPAPFTVENGSVVAPQLRTSPFIYP